MTDSDGSPIIVYHQHQVNIGIHTGVQVMVALWAQLLLLLHFVVANCHQSSAEQEPSNLY